MVVLSQYTAPGYAMALLEHGSAGRAYLLKERVASVDELARAIRAVAGGGSVIDPHGGGRAGPVALGAPAVQPGPAHPPGNRDPGRDGPGQEQRRHRGHGLTVSERAVEKHTNSIFSKLGLSEEKDLNRRVKAVLLYLADTQGS